MQPVKPNKEREQRMQLWTIVYMPSNTSELTTVV